MKRYYFEVSVAKVASAPSRVDPFKRGDKCHWVRKGVSRLTYSECQADAIANGERPYRIKIETVELKAEASSAA